ncbi:hypothetical protein HPB51_012200 [Rhipicephalus microplus]|uniref:Uncharacterized protein n=1 Tax=Rhipicephalus microplus TaxID=6941 RepID=A0A9J6E996_RHIMP|nr:hypothetical protein HPB51_012200 [Rhipicephalus microplus]
MEVNSFLHIAPAPANRDERASAISAGRRSRASKSKISVGSRRSRTSAGRNGDKSGVSKKSGDGRLGSGHEHHKQGEYAADKDSRSASVISLAGDSRSSAKSSRRSLRPIGPEEVPLDRIPEKPKGKLLLMPDGTYVNVQEKNLWIRAMQEKYLAIDYASCSLKFGFGLMLIGFIYIIMFRQVRDYVYDPDANDLPSKNKHKLDNKTFPAKTVKT